MSPSTDSSATKSNSSPSSKRSPDLGTMILLPRCTVTNKVFGGRVISPMVRPISGLSGGSVNFVRFACP